MSVNGKTIAKNTFYLYVRMIVLMLVALYTSRIVFTALGAQDFGIYNVVGGVVVILSFLNGTLSTTSSRYIVVSLAEGDLGKTQKVFSNVFFINLLLSIVVLLLSETIGLWFVNNKMQIPAERLYAAMWVYQISVATTIINILSVPYNAAIIAHERMKAFAYITLFDAFGKLGLAFVVQIVHYDKLIIYALLLFLIQIVDRIIYTRYCLSNFKETRLVYSLDRSLFNNMLRFISWSSYGSFASVGFTQGLNILLNLFYGPTVNAARGIAVQVQNNVTAFINNFQTAINPQLMMSVSKQNNNDAQQLLLTSSRISFYLLCLLGIPIIAETPIIIKFWLGEIPDYTVSFCRIILIINIWGSLANPLRIINQAHGDIRKFQLYECSLLLFIVPVSYISLKLWNIPILVFVVHLIIEFIAQYIRLRIVLPMIKMSIQSYILHIYRRIIPIFLIPLAQAYLIHYIIDENIIRFVVNVVLIEITLLVLIYSMGLSKQEKAYICALVRKKR